MQKNNVLTLRVEKHDRTLCEMNIDLLAIVGANIEARRTALGLIYRQLAESSKCHVNTLTNIIDGKIPTTKLSTLADIAAALETDAATLMGGTSHEVTKQAIEEYKRSPWYQAETPTEREMSWL